MESKHSEVDVIYIDPSISKNRNFCYLLINPQGTTYIGFTSNLIARIEQHNNFRKDKYTYTRDKGPWHLLDWKEFRTREEAYVCEQRYKYFPEDRQEWYRLNLDRARELAFRMGWKFTVKTWDKVEKRVHKEAIRAAITQMTPKEQVRSLQAILEAKKLKEA